MTLISTKRRFLVSGAHGLIGTALSRALTLAGYEVVPLSFRTRGTTCYCDVSNPTSDLARYEGFEGVIHLAGENLASYWTKEKKEQILRSRVATTETLAHILTKLRNPPRVFLSASAVGYYGNGEAIFDENTPSGKGFLADVCVKWENAAREASNVGIRVLHPRIAMVLASEGGALAKMLPAFRLGLGGRLGSGKQFMPWIALEDLVQAFLFALETPALTGAFNVCAPEMINNATFTKILATFLHRPAFFTLPAPLLQLVLGEVTDALLLSNQRIIPRKLLDHGFSFQFPTLSKTLPAILSKNIQ